MECIVQEVPEFLVANLLQLFPGVSLGNEKLNVIVLSQRTVNDMTSWSTEVEGEREQLLEYVSPNVINHDYVCMVPIAPLWCIHKYGLLDAFVVLNTVPSIVHIPLQPVYSHSLSSFLLKAQSINSG